MLFNLINLIKENKLNIHIEKEYSISDSPQAHRYIESGHKKGSIVIDFKTDIQNEVN